MAIQKKTWAVIAGLLVATAAHADGNAGKPERIRGDIVSLAGEALTVHRRSGETVVVELKSGGKIFALKNVTLADIKPGSFVGTAAKTGVDGRLTAQEVLVFPEAARGTGEGHYDWDLGPGSSMTNANVDSVVEANNGRDLKLSYKGGSNQVTVPPGIPIVTIIPADPADLVAGKKVFVIAAPEADGHFKGLNVIVEKDGVVPPM